MFINKFDFFSSITEQTLKQITQGDESLILDAILTAQSEMESYLRERYDVAVEFAKTETDRNPLLKLYMIDLALYHLHTRIAPRSVPETRGIRYEHAIRWLEKVRDGKMSPNLKALRDADNEEVNSMSRHGGNPKVNHQW